MSSSYELKKGSRSHANKPRNEVDVERNLWWIGGFRPSQLFRVILPAFEDSCSQQQLNNIHNLAQSCRQAEDALAQGMEKLHQSLDESTTVSDKGLQQMTFLKQASDVRKKFLYQLSRILTSCQYGQFLLAFRKHLCNPNPSSSL